VICRHSSQVVPSRPKSSLGARAVHVAATARVPRNACKPQGFRAAKSPWEVFSTGVRGVYVCGTGRAAGSALQHSQRSDGSRHWRRPGMPSRARGDFAGHGCPVDATLFARVILSRAALNVMFALSSGTRDDLLLRMDAQPIRAVTAAVGRLLLCPSSLPVSQRSGCTYPIVGPGAAGACDHRHCNDIDRS
jgi:hypothetical protein